MEGKTNIQPDASESRVYELGYLIVPTIAEDKVIDVLDTLRAAVEAQGGRIFSEGTPELKDLAYEMKVLIANRHHKYTQGYFGWIKFEMHAAGIPALEKSLRGNIDLIRFILVKSVLADTRYVPPKQKADTATAPVPGIDGAVAHSPVTEEIAEEIDKKIDNLVVE